MALLQVAEAKLKEANTLVTPTYIIWPVCMPYSVAATTVALRWKPLKRM